MSAEPDIAAAASLLAEPARASIVTALSDGTARPAGDLARGAHVSASAMSAHLSRLLDAGFVKVEQHGRHRYYRLADPALMGVIEALAIVAPAKPIRSLRAAQAADSLTSARTCYDHLAGRLGVRLTDALLGQQVLVLVPTGFDVTGEGAAQLEGLGVPVGELRAQRRNFARPCLDWSERRHHLAGALGGALTRRLLDLVWIRRVDDSRAVRLTAAGVEGFAAHFGMAFGDGGQLVPA